MSKWTLNISRVLGGVVGYGCLAAFLWLISLQIYRWFRDGDWTHIGTNDALQITLMHCCVKGGDTGHLANLSHWISAPVDWLGLHKLLDVVPASLTLLLISIAGNALFIYCQDRAETGAVGT
jgi:hypothetical protein